MARVFVSHAGEDGALAGEIHQWLVEAGHQVFLDQDLRDGIAPGEEWEKRLHERLRWASAVISVVTSAYLDSTWCAAEVGIARSLGIQLLPLRVEPELTHPLLRSVQHIDYTTDPPAARAAVLKALHRVDSTWPDDRSPFPGLRPFDTDQHQVFFGRTDEVQHLTELLRSPAERAKGATLLVVGPSGCGKSSLVRAGLLPAMADQPGWRTLPPILPGADPVAALARELATAARRITLDWTVEHVRHQLDEHGLTGLADELLLADPAGPQQHLLIVVDQFEELLTQTAPADRARFTELLRLALTGPVRVVATLRPEFLDQLLVDPELATLPTRTSTLRPLRRQALRAVIEKPAQLAGIDVDEGLVERLVEDTASGEALPLLAFTLAQLAEGVGRNGRLSRARYEQLGGVQGALTRQADAALVDAVTAGGRSREQVIAGLLRLVTVDEQGRPTRWRVLRDELPGPLITELDAFVERRLLTTDESNGSGVIGVAHEAFLSAWPPLAQAITAAASALRARRIVEHAATEWHENSRLPTRLWSGGQLTAAVADTGARIRAAKGTSDIPSSRRPSRWVPRQHRVLVTTRVDLSTKARDFLHASIRRDRHHRRRRRTVTVLSALLILALAAGIVVVLQSLAQEQQRIATARELVAQTDAARDTDPRTALRLGIAAERIHPDSETHTSLVNTLTSTPYPYILGGHTGPVTSVAFSPDRRTLATASHDHTAILWDLTNPTQPRQLGPPLTGHTGPVTSVAFSPDRRTLATASDDRSVILWDLSDPVQPRRLGPPLTGHADYVHSVAFSPDGTTLATGSRDHTVILWNLSDRTQPRRLGSPLTGHADALWSVTFSPDGHTLATASADHSVILWDLTNPTQPHQLGKPLTGHTNWVFSVAFSPDGHTLGTASADTTVILWDLTNPTQPRQLGKPLTGRVGAVRSVKFSPDGHTLATAGDSSTVILWDLSDPVQPRQLGKSLTSHTDWVSSVAFSPDGRTLATASADHSVILWDLTNPTQPRRLGLPLTGHTGPVTSVAFSPDGHTLATASDDRSVILWDLTTPTQPRQLGPSLTGHTDYVHSVAFSPDGTTLATGSRDHTLILWNLSDRTQPRRLGSPLTGHADALWSVAFSPDGHTLATASADHSVILWDLTNPTQPRQLGKPLTGHTNYVFSVAFSPDGRTLATASADHSVILWDLTNPTQPRQLGKPLTSHGDAVWSVRFSFNGHILATASADTTVILWDLSDPVQPRRLGKPLTSHTGPVISVAFSPEGQTLATASADTTVILWDLTDPAQSRSLNPPLTGHTGLVSSVAFSSDAHTLATASHDKTAILWDLTDLNDLRTHATEHACSITGNGLDRDQWARYIPGLPYENTCPA